MFALGTWALLHVANHHQKPRSVLRSPGCHRLPHNTLPNAAFLRRFDVDSEAQPAVDKMFALIVRCENGELVCHTHGSLLLLCSYGRSIVPCIAFV